MRRSWTQAATLAGLKARGGHFNAGKKALVDGGHVREEGGLVQIVQPSAAAAAPSSNPAALVEIWAGVIGGAGARVLRDLFEAGGSDRRGNIADRLGMQPRGGHWNAGIKALRDNDIVTVNGDRLSLTELFRSGLA